MPCIGVEETPLHYSTKMQLWLGNHYIYRVVTRSPHFFKALGAVSKF